MTQKFDSTARVPKKNEDYWIDVVDEGVGKSGLPNKTRRQGILNLLEDRMRKDSLLRLGFQELVGDDPSASGIVTLMERLTTPQPQKSGREGGERHGVMLPALGSYIGYEPIGEYVRKQIERRVAEGKAPSHLPPTDFDSTQENYQYSTGLPSGAFRNRPIAAYAIKDDPGDRRAPPGYDPAYWRGIMSLAHEIRHAGFDALKRTPTGTEPERRAVDEVLRKGGDEPFQRAYDAAYRKHDPLSRKFMSKWTVEKEKEGMRLYPKPYDNPIQSAAAKMLRNKYAGKELYAPLARQPR